MNGVVKVYRNGWGYIQPDDGTKDVYVHWTDLQRAGLSGLTQGQRVDFDAYEQADGKGPRVKRIAVREQPDSVEKEPHATALPLREQSPGTALVTWAYLPGLLTEVVTDLKTKALPERWTFAAVPNPAAPFPILYNYLRYTFAKLFLEQERGERKIVVAQDKTMAVFNTGLVNPLYKPLFAVFEPNRNVGRQQWKFRGFCVAGEHGLGKELVRRIYPLPDRAKYFDHVTDMIYTEPSRVPETEWDHVVLDGIKRDRFPTAFLAKHVPPGFDFKDPAAFSNERPVLAPAVEGAADAGEEAPDSTNPSPREEYLGSLALAIEGSDATRRRIVGDLERAVDIALRRVAWNFKTAVPMWYPTRNLMSLLLPLSLVHEEQIDLALVVEKAPSGAYIGHTVLPLHLAYMNARLVCRPDSDWLRPESIPTSSSPGVGDDLLGPEKMWDDQ